MQSCWLWPVPKGSHLKLKSAKLPRSLARGTQPHHDYLMGCILKVNQCSVQVGSEEVTRVWLVSGNGDDLKNNWDIARAREMKGVPVAMFMQERIEVGMIQGWELALSISMAFDLWFGGHQKKVFIFSTSHPLLQLN